MPPNPYDQIEYSTYPRLKTHPDRLAAVATFFGMEPPPVGMSRVLEIGCGNGNNLIPMAYAMPGSRFTGIDLAQQPIAAGNRAIAELELRNISLVATDLLAFEPAAGEFDYIIAHGLYSWVPQHVRNRLMAVCREALSPQGIAFISYNAYPGRHVREMLREMMLYHTRGTTEPAERVRKARWFLDFVLNARLLSAEWAALLDGEAKALLSHGEGGLYHDDLATINDSFYFRDFADHARQHGLQYLGEADFHEMFDPKGSLAWLKNDLLEREQYLDFLRLRRFRQTLLCRQEVQLNRKPEVDIVERLLFSAPAQTVDGDQIEGFHGVRISAKSEAVTRITAALGEMYPLPVSFEDLLPYAGDRIAAQEILFALVTGGFAAPHVYDFPCEDSVTEKPKASRLVRHQAAQSRYVTSACHHVIELDEIGRHLIQVLDGMRTHAEIARELSSMTFGASREEIQKRLEESLEWFARQGLLEG